MIYRSEKAIVFTAGKPGSMSLQLKAVVVLENNGLAVSFFLFDPDKLVKLEFIREDLAFVRFTAVSGIENRGYSIVFPYYKKIESAYLNSSLVDDGKIENVATVHFGRILAARDSLTIDTGKQTFSWFLSNLEALYAAALVLKPDLTFDEFLAAF